MTDEDNSASPPPDLAHIDRVIRRLGAIVDDAHANASRLGFFPAVYLQMSRAVRQGIQDGVFDDGGRMSEFDELFALRYFDALTAWEAGDATTRSWRAVFRAAEDPNRLVLQTLLMSINAHINLDLPVVAAVVNPGGHIGDFGGDFDRINDILGRILDQVEDAVARFSPLLGVLDRVGGRTEDQVLDFSFREARSEAWREAVLLAQLDPAQREQAIALLDRKVAFLGRIIEGPGGILGRAVEVIGFTESDDVPAIIDGLRNIIPPTLR
ncbi:MAG: DUF5995 family protein [Actinomycetota bacterium]|nr:DUF5995 family protein [Actinomycetota bacterium]